MRAKRLLPTLILLLVLASFLLPAQEPGENAGMEAAPRLAGIVDLGSLSLLWDDDPGTSGSAGAPRRRPAPSESGRSIERLTIMGYFCSSTSTESR